MKVKRKKQGRPRISEKKLESIYIIQTAKSLILSECKVPSIRKLASELNVDPMAIYYYFPNKQAILEAVTMSLIGEIYAPNSIVSWRENLMSLCKSYLKLLASYPDLLQIILSVSAEGPTSIFQERFETAIEKLNLAKNKKKIVMSVLIDYIHGFSLASHGCISIDLTDAPLNFIFDALKKSH